MSYTLAADAHFGPSKAGLTLTASYVNSDHTVNGAGSAVITDAGNGDYDCLLTVPDGFQGWFRLKNGATLLGSWALDPRETENADVKTSTVSGGAGGASDPWPTMLPNDALYPAGTAGYRVGHYLDVAIGSRAPNGTVGITVTSPVASNGDIWITIGDDYGPVPAFQQRITHTLKAGSEPDYTGGSAVYAAPLLAGSPFAATLVAVGPGIDQTFALDLAHATTAGLLPGDYPFALEATTATGQRTTPREGVIHVRPATP